MDDVVLQTVTLMLLPFIQTYGIYIMVNGHLTPGGGFAGGAVLGISLILYALTFHVDEAAKVYPRRKAEALESLGALVFIFIGLLGVLGGAAFLTNNTSFLSGQAGTLLGGGFILPVTVAVGLKVASTVVTLFFHLLEEEKR